MVPTTHTQCVRCTRRCAELQGAQNQLTLQLPLLVTTRRMPLPLELPPLRRLPQHPPRRPWDPFSRLCQHGGC